MPTPIAAALLLVLHACVFAAETPLVPEGAAVEQVATGYRFTEGPALGPDATIYFSDVPNRKVHVFNPATGETAVHLEDSGGSNGLAFDHQGRLVLCVDRDRYLGRLEGGKLLVVEDGYEGKRFNGPNDLAIDADNNIYFTDPAYGRREGRELGVEAVYFVPRMGEVKQLITDLKRPNGIALSPDGQTLYVADNAAGLVMAYDVAEPGRIENARVFAKPQAARGGPDGMTIDRAGNLYAAWHGANAVYVWSPAGEPIATIPVPDAQPTNVAFGADGETLYVTAGKSLYRIRLNVPE